MRFNNNDQSALSQSNKFVYAAGSNIQNPALTQLVTYVDVVFFTDEII